MLTVVLVEHYFLSKGRCLKCLLEDEHLVGSCSAATQILRIVLKLERPTHSLHDVQNCNDDVLLVVFLTFVVQAGAVMVLGVKSECHHVGPLGISNVMQLLIDGRNKGYIDS